MVLTQTNHKSNFMQTNDETKAAPVEVNPYQIRQFPLSDRVVVSPANPDDITKGGIIIPDMGKETPQRGIVCAVGPGRDLESVMQVSVGEEVLYGKYAGTEIQIEGKDYLIMRETDIFMILRYAPEVLEDYRQQQAKAASYTLADTLAIFASDKCLALTQGDALRQLEPLELVAKPREVERLLTMFGVSRERGHITQPQADYVAELVEKYAAVAPIEGSDVAEEAKSLGRLAEGLKNDNLEFTTLSGRTVTIKPLVPEILDSGSKTTITDVWGPYTPELIVAAKALVEAWSYASGCRLSIFMADTTGEWDKYAPTQILEAVEAMRLVDSYRVQSGIIMPGKPVKTEAAKALVRAWVGDEGNTGILEYYDTHKGDWSQFKTEDLVAVIEFDKLLEPYRQENGNYSLAAALPTFPWVYNELLGNLANDYKASGPTVPLVEYWQVLETAKDHNRTPEQVVADLYTLFPTMATSVPEKANNTSGPHRGTRDSDSWNPHYKEGLANAASNWDKAGKSYSLVVSEDLHQLAREYKMSISDVLEDLYVLFPELNTGKLKTTPFQDLKAKYVGEEGSPERTSYENELAAEIEEKNYKYLHNNHVYKDLPPSCLLKIKQAVDVWDANGRNGALSEYPTLVEVASIYNKPLEKLVSTAYELFPELEAYEALKALDRKVEQYNGLFKPEQTIAEYLGMSEGEYSEYAEGYNERAKALNTEMGDQAVLTPIVQKSIEVRRKVANTPAELAELAGVPVGTNPLLPATEATVAKDVADALAEPGAVHDAVEAVVAVATGEKPKGSVDALIEQRIEAWHSHRYPEQYIFKALGWTEQQYADWVKDPNNIPAGTYEYLWCTKGAEGIPYYGTYSPTDRLPEGSTKGTFVAKEAIGPLEPGDVVSLPEWNTGSSVDEAVTRPIDPQHPEQLPADKGGSSNNWLGDELQRNSGGLG